MTIDCDNCKEQYRCTLDDNAYCAELTREEAINARRHIEHWFDLLYRPNDQGGKP